MLDFECAVTLLTSIPASSIREVIAFPKTSGGLDPLSGAPTPIPSERWSEMGLMEMPREEE